MLPEIVNHIERGLVSYIKRMECYSPTTELNGGIRRLVARATTLSDHRKHDILAIDQLCEEAINQNSSVAALLRQVVAYLHTIKTGFWIFSGSSKLRDSIIQAIEQYDLQYLTWINGRVVVDSHEDVQEPLRGHREIVAIQERQLWHYQEDVLGPVQMQIKQLMDQMSQQKELIRENRQELGNLKGTLLDTQRQLDQSQSDLLESQAENLKLRTKLMAIATLPKKPFILSPQCLSIQSSTDDEEPGASGIGVVRDAQRH